VKVEEISRDSDFDSPTTQDKKPSMKILSSACASMQEQFGDQLKVAASQLQITKPAFSRA
jgi:hypothetical protein